MPSGESLRIVQVSPHPWGSRHEVNEFVERLSAELAGRGHRVLIAAPSESRAQGSSSRAAIARARDRPDSLFAASEPQVLAVGGGVPLPRGPRPRPAPVPVDVGRALEALLGAVPLDVVHVHEPFGPSVSSTALRHSFSLNVGTFHEPQERLFSTHIARPLVEIFFGRLDVRTVTSAVTGELLERYFPGS